MNIILKYILTNMKERKVRTIVMLFSIILSTVLLFVSFSIAASYESAQEKMAKGISGKATVAISRIEGEMSLSDVPELDEIKTQAGVMTASAIYKEKGYYETIDLVAMDIEALNKINKPVMQDGSELIELRGDEIVLPDRFTSKYGLKQGESITLDIDSTPKVFTLTKIATYDTVFLRQTRGATALVPEETLSKIKGGCKSYNRVLFFALTMSVFIIYSSYKVITLERLPVIGTFRSIGATEKKVTRILLLESFVYGILGGILGIPIGVLALKVILNDMGKALAQGISIPVVISIPGICLALGDAVIVTLLSAWLPIRRASKLPIKEIILGKVEERYSMHPVVVSLGVILFIASQILPKVTKGKALYLAGGFSLLGLIGATLLIIPLVTNVFSIIFEYVHYKLFGNIGKLAARNMKDNKNITQNITLLFISISAIIVISVVGNFVTTYICDVFCGATIEGFADGKVDKAFVEKVKNMEGIESVLPLYVLSNSVKNERDTFSRLEGTDDLGLYNEMLALHYTDEAVKREAVEAFNSGERVIVVSEKWLKGSGHLVGDSMNLTKGQGEMAYRIVGSFKARATDVEAVIPAAWACTDFGATSYDFLGYTAADPETVMVQIRQLFGEQANWSRTIEEFNKDALNTVGSFLAPMHSMTYFILLLAAIGVINNLLIGYIQKRHTIAMYKSVGLSNKQNIKMILIENFTSGLIGAECAVLVAYQEIRTIFIVAGPKIEMVPEISMKPFLLAVGFGIALTFIGSIIPIVKSRKMKLIEEIKFE